MIVVDIYVLWYLLPLLLLPCAIQPLAAIHELDKFFIELNCYNHRAKQKIEQLFINFYCWQWGYGGSPPTR